MFRLPCGEGNETQNRSNGIVRETCTHHQAVLKSVMHQKQVIADSSDQVATVWDARRSTSLILGERVQPKVKRNHESVDMSTKKRKPLGSTIEEFVFGTKEVLTAPTPLEVVSSAPTPTTSLTPPTQFALLPAATLPPPFAFAPHPVPTQSKEPSLMSKRKAPDKEATVRFTVDMSETLHRKLSMLTACDGAQESRLLVRMLLEDGLKKEA